MCYMSYNRKQSLSRKGGVMPIWIQDGRPSLRPGTPGGAEAWATVVPIVLAGYPRPAKLCTRGWQESEQAEGQ
jgi:hypothetical protein